jgi:hypothetical protein
MGDISKYLFHTVKKFDRNKLGTVSFYRFFGCVEEISKKPRFNRLGFLRSTVSHVNT